MKTRITELLGIEYPVVQGAMARIADGGLAGAVSEAGGHIGELTTMALVPSVAAAVSIPVIAAGGIVDGRGMLAAFAVLALYTFGRAVYDIGRNDGSRMETGHAGRVELPTPAETDNHLTPYLYGTEEE